MGNRKLLVAAGAFDLGVTALAAVVRDHLPVIIFGVVLTVAPLMLGLRYRGFLYAYAALLGIGMGFQAIPPYELINFVVFFGLLAAALLVMLYLRATRSPWRSPPDNAPN